MVDKQLTLRQGIYSCCKANNNSELLSLNNLFLFQPLLFLCVISIFGSNMRITHWVLKKFVTVEISINVHLVLKDDLEFSKWINRDGHYIQRDQYVQKPWNWEGENGGVPGVQRQGEEVVLLAELAGDTCMASLECSVSKNRVNSLQSCLLEDLYNLLFIMEYKKQTIGATTYYVLLIYFSSIVGTLWMS